MSAPKPMFPSPLKWLLSLRASHFWLFPFGVTCSFLAVSGMLNGVSMSITSSVSAKGAPILGWRIVWFLSESGATSGPELPRLFSGAAIFNMALGPKTTGQLFTPEELLFRGGDVSSTGARAALR